ncbi:MAG: hypothetical protein HY903_20410 [Deltaproteobacteria bacterium]|nr:hypothetical protein [Deltaproteobacteria bacterium]
MPALINIAANILFGAGLVLVLRRSEALRANLVSWAFFVLLGFEAVLVTPVATYLFRFYPQWSMLYLFDPQIFPELDRYIGVLSLFAVLLNVGAAFVGFFLARLALVAGQTWIWAAPLGAAAGVILTVGVLHGHRVLYVGDYDEFWQGNAVFLLKSAAGWVGLILYAAAGLLLTLVHRRFKNHDPRIL